jgi:oxygen-independent coproporphyrinogen-3 oxidase
MRFGVYIHIPYCLQRCTYCDFATYEHSKIMPSEQYTDLVKEEIRQKKNAFGEKRLSTVYFGGGTPSLLPSQQILSILDELEKQGFVRGPETETTIEINPATVDDEKLRDYLKAGINRFSVGAQTFDDPLLKFVHREHNAEQTRQTLRLLANHGLNYSFDLLFALPGQTVDMLKRDLDEVLAFRPPHVSPYCLTVPEGHVLSKNRPLEDDQLRMFELIRETLQRAGYRRYEISNFAVPGAESRHNSLYWDDEPYWGIGLSAHSYSKDREFGVRYWNPSSIGTYQDLIERNRGRQFATPFESLASEAFEVLSASQALTDFCHISLRRNVGLDLKQLEKKFGPTGLRLVKGPLQHMVSQGWIEQATPERYRLSEDGLLLSNQVFAALTFLSDEWSAAKA